MCVGGSRIWSYVEFNKESFIQDICTQTIKQTIKVIGNLFLLLMALFQILLFFSDFFSGIHTSEKQPLDILALFVKIGPLGTKEWDTKWNF